MSNNKLPQYVVNAIRRRARAAEQLRLADERITEYCKRLGLDTEHANGNIEIAVKTDPDPFIKELEICLAKKTQGA